MPLTAFTVVVPFRAPPLGLVPIAIVTLAVDRLLVLPAASWMATLMPPAGLLPIVLLTVELIGCAVNASCVGAPMTIKSLETLLAVLLPCVATTVCVPAVAEG